MKKPSPGGGFFMHASGQRVSLMSRSAATFATSGQRLKARSEGRLWRVAVELTRHFECMRCELLAMASTAGEPRAPAMQDWESISSLPVSASIRPFPALLQKCYLQRIEILHRVVLEGNPSRLKGSSLSSVVSKRSSYVRFQ